MKPPGKHTRFLSEEEAALWHIVTEHDAPLKRNGEKTLPLPPTPPSITPQPSARRLPDPLLEDALKRLAENGIGAPNNGSPLPVATLTDAGHIPGLDRRTSDKLRKGQLPIDATLDLHGMSQQDAFLALHHAVENACAQRKRLLLIITGKGKNSAQPDRILKYALPGWLESPVIKPLILAYREAAAAHGGGGAIYLLLRRQRNGR